jgi:Xaa-Pro aminopeptidase
MLGFETLTLAPFDQRLIVPELLTAEELEWLNAYHARVRKELSPQLKGAALKWLKAATAQL